jgi:hypothetical protein
LTAGLTLSVRSVRTTPALLAVLTPVVVGFGIDWKALGAFLAAVILVGQLMANYLSNAGGAWDNAKKYIEDGHHGGKGSDAHKAAVVGDTVGDPFKDTSSVSLNPVIKFTTLFGLLALIGLPRWNHPLFASKNFPKFSDDGFFVCIEARDPKFSQEGTKALLEKAGGKNIELVEDEL